MTGPMHVPRREFLLGGASAGLLSTACWPAASDMVTPEAFGAKGDGRTNDTDAFAAMSAHVSARGGGIVVLRPVTYIVGKHVPSSTVINQPFAYLPATIMHFAGCTGAVTVQGNGATLRCQSGLRYGTFDPATGRRTDRHTPNYKREERASPYVAMIRAETCSGPVTISDIELDGNLQRLVIGGKYGNAGWQIPGYGIQLLDNSGPERLSRINSHHHAHDGLYIKGSSQRAASSVIADVTCDYNGRQGCSITGGRNYAFERCRFRHTGKVVFRSAPGAGLDIEPQKSLVRNISFTACDFSDNAGPGLLAPAGNSEGISCEGCTFVGTTSWAAWPKKPRVRFSNCTFVGAIVHAYGDPDPARAAQFHACTFRDDPKLSPTGQVFTGKGRNPAIANLPRSENVLFSRCHFALTHDGVLPFSTRLVRFSDCEMSQASPRRSRPRGTYLGTSRVNGNADLGGSVISGTVILNGLTLPPGEVPGGPGGARQL
jgi:hypothetical protein